MPRTSHIILVSFCAAPMGVAQQIVYAATQASFLRVWATELGQSKGITVSYVNPGPVATDGYFTSTEKPLIELTPVETRVGE